MDPDSDSPVSRVERTFWTVWYYITGAVNRLLRPEPTDTVSSDPNSLQESASNSEPADNGLTQGDTSREEVDEERPLAAATVLSLSGAVVAWEICKTKDSDSKEDEESTEHESLLIEGSESKVSEEGESTREGQFSQAENDDAGLLSPKDSRAEKAEEDETVQLPKDEQVLEEEDDTEIKLCTITESGLEKDDNRKMDEPKVQSDDNPTALMPEELEITSVVSQLVSEHIKESDEGEKPEISVCELWSDSDTGVKLDTGKDQMTDHKSESDEAEDEQEDESMLHEREQCEEENVSEAESKETIDEESEQEEDIQSVREDSREKDILTKFVEGSIDDLQNTEPESKVSEEGENTREGQFSQAENDDVGLLSPKDSKAEKAEEEEESVPEEETQRTMTPEDPKKMDETVQLPKYEQVLEEEDDTEIKLCTITESGLEKEDNMQMDEPKVKRDDTTIALMPEELEITSVVSQLVSEYIKESDEGEKPQISVCELWTDGDTGVKLDTGKHQMTDHKSESDESEDEQEDESMLHEREQCEEENVSEAERKETIDEESEQEEDIQSVREDSREKDILTKCVARSIDDLQNAEPESKVSEEGENMREEQFSQTENGDAGLLSPKDSRAEKAEEEEESVLQKVEAQRQVEDVEYEETLKTESLTPTDVGMNEITEEETQRTMAPEDPKKMDETLQLQEEHNKRHPEDEQHDTQLYTITESGEEEEDNRKMVQSDDNPTALMHEELEIGSGVSQLVYEYVKESDEGEKPEISVCELCQTVTLVSN
ncbi:hypothetical protein Q5P01_023289 [Channa striata]|uniref:Uncharacterized protein n=1 Tax=Channa striata TaxID=64152 RepID=A0AA88ITE3_CHASR|nr:hypothetical protein Q5P01_023289 [Channa striata]